MSLLAAAVVPVPPLLVPEVAGGSAASDERLRQACRAAAACLRDRPVIVVGGAPATRPYRGGYDFRPFGVAFPDEPPAIALPAALGIGAWLLGAAADRFQGVRPDESPQTCRELGRALVADDDVCLLVCADGSARRSEKAPGHLDPRAAAFDHRVESALGAGDSAALAALEPGLAAELMCGGRAAWQVLAGAAGESGWTAKLLHSEAPYGVSYFVATWTS